MKRLQARAQILAEAMLHKFQVFPNLHGYMHTTQSFEETSKFQGHFFISEKSQPCLYSFDLGSYPLGLDAISCQLNTRNEMLCTQKASRQRQTTLYPASLNGAPVQRFSYLPLAPSSPKGKAHLKSESSSRWFVPLSPIPPHLTPELILRTG